MKEHRGERLGAKGAYFNHKTMINLFTRRVSKLRRYSPILKRELAHKLHGGADRIALVVPPVGSGSLGDQAMLQSIADHLALFGCTHFRQFLMPSWETFTVQGPELLRCRFGEFDVAAAGPALLNAVRKSSAVVAIGADVIDGRYGLQAVRLQTGVLQIAARCGVPAALLGHSISEKPDPEAMRLLTELPPQVAIYARDPVSGERFAKQTGRAPTIAADLAFLVHPDRANKQHAAVRAWMDQQRKQGNVLLCLNINGLTAEQQSGGLGAVVYWQRFVSHLLNLQPHLAVTCLSHDPRPQFSDTEVHARVVAGLPPAMAQQCLLAPDFVTAAQAKAVSMLADVVLTGRMHLAIGALSQGTPTYCVAYAGKFEGLARHVGAAELVVPASALAHPETAAAWLASRLPQLPQYRKALAARLPLVLDLARKNFSFGAI